MPAKRGMGGERSESKRSEGQRSDGERSDGESIEERWKRTMRQVAVPLSLKNASTTTMFLTFIKNISTVTVFFNIYQKHEHHDYVFIFLLKTLAHKQH